MQRFYIIVSLRSRQSMYKVVRHCNLITKQMEMGCGLSTIRIRSSYSRSSSGSVIVLRGAQVR